MLAEADNEIKRLWGCHYKSQRPQKQISIFSIIFSHAFSVSMLVGTELGLKGIRIANIYLSDPKTMDLILVSAILDHFTYQVPSGYYQAWRYSSQRSPPLDIDIGRFILFLHVTPSYLPYRRRPNLNLNQSFRLFLSYLFKKSCVYQVWLNYPGICIHSTLHILCMCIYTRAR